MTDWIERIEQHAVHQSLEELESALSSVKTNGEDLGAKDTLSRLRHVVQFTQRAIAQADPLLLSPGVLDPLNKRFSQIAGELGNFTSNSDVTHLNNASSVADALLPGLNNIIAPRTPEDVKGVASTIKAFDASTKKHVVALRAETEQGKSEVQALQAEVKELSQLITNEKSRIDQAVNQHQQQFSEAQNTRQQRFDEQETQRSDKSDASSKSWEAKFDSLETIWTTKLDDLNNTFKDNHDEIVRSSQSETQTLLQDIESRREKAKEIVGLIAGTGMAGGYQRDADAERQSFQIWNGAAVLGFAGLIIFSVWLFFAATGDAQFGWLELGARSVAIVAFGLFAAFAGRMAMKHRESERRHRHKQLALESVNAFVEDLEPEVQKQLKQQMADAFFIQDGGASDHDHDVAPTTIDGLMKLLSRAIDRVGK
ncbi:MAG: hypothetical protein ACR2QH_13030 [Geminicoccaceae bacterium]